MLNPHDSHSWQSDSPLGFVPLCTMEWMYDDFYKVLWKILRRRGSSSGSISGVRADHHNGVAKHGGYALTFAGCRQGDGASTMAFNFASAFASYSAKSVLLVDGNLRQPILHFQFSGKKSVGLTDLVEGRASVEEAVLEIAPGRYYFLRSGAKSVSPVLLYESDDFLAVVDQLRARFDVIIFDCPPLVDNPESVLLASATDGVVLILQANKTRWEVASAALRDLEDVRVPVLGAILNKRQHIIPENLYRLL